MPRLIDEARRIIEDEVIGNEETRRTSVSQAKEKLRQRLPVAVRSGEDFLILLWLDENGYDRKRGTLTSQAYLEFWDWIRGEGLIPEISCAYGYNQEHQVESHYYIGARIPKLR